MHLPDYAWNYNPLCSYINCSDEPNVCYDVDSNEFFSIRDVCEGEELLCNFKKDLYKTDCKLKFLE